MGYAFPGTSANATAKVGAAVGRSERGLVGIAAAKAIRAVADGGTAELAVLTPAEAIDDYSKVALRRHFELGILFPFPNCLNEVESPHTIKRECGMSIIVDLYEIFVERGTAKKKARGAAGAGDMDQYFVTKEDLLAKRLIEQQQRLTAPHAAKNPRSAQQ